MPKTKINALKNKTKELRLPGVPLDIHKIILIEQLNMKAEKGFCVSLTKTLTSIIREWSCLKNGENCE